MNKLYAWVAKLILNRIFVGKSADVIGWILTIVGVFNIVFSTENMQELCVSHNICLAGNATVGWISAALGEIAKILRFGKGLNADDPQVK